MRWTWLSRLKLNMLHITSSCGCLSKWDVIYSSLHNASLRHYGKAFISENRPEKYITHWGETQSRSHSLIFLCFFIAFFPFLSFQWLYPQKCPVLFVPLSRVWWLKRNSAQANVCTNSANPGDQTYRSKLWVCVFAFFRGSDNNRIINRWIERLTDEYNDRLYIER